MARKYQELRDKMPAESRARVEARVQAAIAEMPLNELRRARDLTQATLATTMETSQSEISKIEQRTDCYVSTLRNYIEAMGGELDIVARFRDGGIVKVSQFSDLNVGNPKQSPPAGDDR
ncbi:MAG: XRE family transcriptional regulator [Chloroflexi bacterium]|nr:XRE family transcriptional regulator [Chloroflexota bacterium]